MASLTFAVGRPTPLVGYPVSRRVVSLGRGRAAVCPPRRAGDADFIIETGDAPGEGKRTRPGPSADAASERASLEAPKGPQVNSAGVAPDEVAPLEDAFAKLSEYPFSEWPRASDRIRVSCAHCSVRCAIALGPRLVLSLSDRVGVYSV